jgi:hypothetical protein
VERVFSSSMMPIAVGTAPNSTPGYTYLLGLGAGVGKIYGASLTGELDSAFVYDPRSGSCSTLSIPGTGSNLKMPIVADDSGAYFGSNHGHVYRYDASSGQATDLGSVGDAGYVGSLARTSDGRLIGGDADGRLFLYDPAQAGLGLQTLISNVGGLAASIPALAVTPSSVVYGAAGSHLFSYDLTSRAYSDLGEPFPISSLAVGTNGRLYAGTWEFGSGTGGGRGVEYDLSTGTVTTLVKAGSKPGLAAIVTADSSGLVYFLHDNAVYTFDTTTRKLTTAHLASDQLWAIAVRPEGGLAVGGAAAGRLWVSGTTMPHAMACSQAPTIASITPNRGTANGGNPVTLTGTALRQVSSVSFGTGTATIRQQSNTSIRLMPPAGSGFVAVTATTADGSAVNVITGSVYYTYCPCINAVSPTYGPAAGGTTLTLAGVGLDTVTSVVFTDHDDDNNLLQTTTVSTFLKHSSTTIRLISPAGSGYATVSVGGLINGGFGYAPLPNNVLPVSGSTAGGTRVTITGGNFKGLTSVTMGGLDATIKSQSAVSVTVISPAHAAGAVDVTLTGPGGSRSIRSAFTYK